MVKGKNGLQPWRAGEAFRRAALVDSQGRGRKSEAEAP
jgi:hypothetical protein